MLSVSFWASPTPTNTTPSTTTRLSKIESTVRYLGIEVDDAIEIAEKIHLISDAIANQRTWSAAVSEVADRGWVEFRFGIDCLSMYAGLGPASPACAQPRRRNRLRDQRHALAAIQLDYPHLA
jgi:hypothetical protein